MQYTEIPYVNKKVSRILFGTAGDGFQAGEDENELLDAIYDTGVNTFDTARQYALSENTLGKWIAARGNRDEIVLLSKCGHPNPSGEKRINEKAIREDFARSCEALGTDHIDIYLLHRDDPDVEVGRIVEVFNALHDEGKIGAFGGSNWTHQRIQEANEYAEKHGLIPFSVSSPNFGLADQVKDLWGGGCVTISGPANEAAREWYRNTQMPVVAYSSLGRGLFSGRVRGAEPENASKYMDEYAMKGYGYPENFERLRRCEELAEKKHCSVPQIAMAWIFRQNLNTFAVVSTTKASRMQENIDALHIELSKEESRYLDLKIN
jgi:aryl-alcohol dehydrogenase-like predicted oxidoreductase